MKIITVATLKGGVGKSNFSFNLGGILAQNSKKVLLIDADQQANLTLNVGVDITNQKATIKDIFENNNINMDSVVIKSPIEELPTLDIITSDLILYKTEIQLVLKPARETILARYFKENKDKLKNYDYIIIDTNPSFSLTNQNAFLVADEIILLSDVSLNAIQGAELFMALWNDIRKDLGLDNNINSLILSNVDRRLKLSTELIDYCNNNESLKSLKLENIIYNSKVFKETELEHKPINILAKNSNQHKNYIELIEELYQKNIL